MVSLCMNKLLVQHTADELGCVSKESHPLTLFILVFEVGSFACTVLEFPAHNIDVDGFPKFSNQNTCSATYLRLPPDFQP